MKLGRDGVAGLIGLAITLILLPQALGLPKLPIVPIGPGFYPTIVLAFLGIMSAVLVAQDMFAQRKLTAAPGAAVATATRDYTLVAIAFLLVSLYIAALPLIGFRLSTLLFVALFQIAMERPETPQKWAIILAIAAATTAVTYTVFNDYLLVLLPRGAWTGW